MKGRTLVVHASRHGHSAVIAGRVAAVLSEMLPDVRVHDLGEGADPDPASATAVVVVASVHVGRHPQSVVDWILRHRAALSDPDRPSLLLSVTLTAAEDSDEARELTQGLITELVEQTGWRPGRSEAIAGAIQWTAYGRVTRLLMRMKLRRRTDIPRDRTRDVELTDWPALDRVVRELGRDVAEPAPADPARGSFVPTQ